MILDLGSHWFENGPSFSKANGTVVSGFELWFVKVVNCTALRTRISRVATAVANRAVVFVANADEFIGIRHRQVIDQDGVCALP